MPEPNQDMMQTVERLAALVIRRRWWLIASTFIVGCLVALGSLALPNKFTSESTILVVQQQVPKRYVTPNTTYSVQEALQSLTEAVLSRSHLLPIINEFSLYPKERGRLGPEGLSQLMRSKIQIEPIQIDPIQKESTETDINAFKISFTGDSGPVAQKVTDRLTSFFIDENLKLQQQQDLGTTGFLKDQLASAGRDLKEQESRLRDFRLSNLGQLPEQEQGNLEILSGLHVQLQSTMADLSRAQEQRVYLSSLLDQYRALDSTGNAAPGSAAAESPLAAAEITLNQLKTQRASLLARFQPQYPDVIEINRKIADQQAVVAALKPASGAKGASTGGGAETSSEAQLRSQLEANRTQMADLTASEKRMEQQIADYEQRLNATPVRGQQLSEILREYDQTKKHYDDLLGKVTESEMATSLAERQQGQQFRVIDPPSLPREPSSPKRSKIALGGAAAGLLLGGALAFLIDSRDHSFYAEKEIMQRLKLSLVVGVPLALAPAEISKRARNRRLEWAGGALLLVLLMAAELFVLKKG